LFARKIRTAQLAQANYILVVGDKEMENSTVHVRTRDGNDVGALTMAALETRFAADSIPLGMASSAVPASS
jgi:threonyl-tRNA synthetase